MNIHAGARNFRKLLNYAHCFCINVTCLYEWFIRFCWFVFALENRNTSNCLQVAQETSSKGVKGQSKFIII